MSFKLWLRKAFAPWVRNSRASRRGKCRQPSRHRCLPRLEWLEDRLAPAVYTVTSAADSGAGTLRQAILDSEANHGFQEQDTIQFSPTLDGQTINLTSFINNGTVAGPSAFAINNSDNLVIDGETGLTHGITISRDTNAADYPNHNAVGFSVPNFRFFFVDSGSDLTLKGLTLSGGVAQGGDGGSGGGAGGGGAAGMGGAIFNEGQVTIRDSTLTGNTAQGGNGAAGSDVNGGGGGGGLGSSGNSGVFVDNPFPTGSGFYGAGGNGGGPNGGAGSTDPIHPNGIGGGFGGGGGGGYGFGGFDTGFIPFYGRGASGGFGGGGGGGGSGDIGNYSGDPGGNGGFGGGGGGGGNHAYGGAGGGFGGGTGSGNNGGGGAGMGGAIFNYAGRVTITNSTLQGNNAFAGHAGNNQATVAAKGLGGGVFNFDGQLFVNDSTLAENYAPDNGGGVYSIGNGAGNPEADAFINNSIIANSYLSSNHTLLSPNDLAIVVNGGAAKVQGEYNLVGTSSIDTSTSVIDQFSDRTQLTGDPMLGPLQDNGGWTKTMALLAGSPAIDMAGSTLIGTVFFDQRGLPRNADAQAAGDIGAYERQVQTITFGSLAPKTFGDPDFTISATATSGLPVNFTSSDNTVASVSQDSVTKVWTVHINGAGSATITAHQGGDTYLYNAAPDVKQTLSIDQFTPTVTVSDAGGNFTGLAYPATGSVIGVNNTNIGTPTFQYYLASDTAFAHPLLGAPTKVGSYVVVASYAGSANYTSASANTSFAILSSQQQAGKLTDQINTLVSTGALGAGNGNALTKSLSSAAASFAANNPTAGINQVTAFINKVNDFLRSGILTAAEAQSLLDAANAIIASARPFVLVSSVGNTIPAGTPFNLTATVVDLLGNVVHTFTGTVKITDSVTGATLPAKYTFTTGAGGDNGVHTFTGLVLNTKGSQTLTVTDAKTGLVLGSLTVNVV